MTSVLRIDDVLNGSVIVCVDGELGIFLVMMVGLIVGIFVGPLSLVA